MKDFLDKFIQTTDWTVGKFNMLPIFFGVMLAMGDIVMMTSAKMMSQGTLSSSVGMPISIGSYAGVGYLFMRLLNYEGMVVTNLVWNMMSDVIVTLSGVLIFGESIKGLRWLAICMSLVALGIFAYTDDK